ncbi:hypothetical protein KJ039_03800 [bacterium]|nr:hypothetical protein [bacterium]
MAERPVIIARDEDKARLQALLRRPVWTPQERDEILRMLLKKAVAG